MKNVMFGTPSKYDTGVNPSVSMVDNGLFVEVHKSENHSNLYYTYGQLKLDGQNRLVKVLAQTGESVGASGFNPTVYLNESGVAIAVFQSDDSTSSNNDLWYVVGKGDSNNVSWGTAYKISNCKGLNPAVLIDNDNNALLVFEHTDGSLWMAFGTVTSSSKTAHFDAPSSYSTGHNPAIAIDDHNNIVEAHDNSGIVYYSFGTINFGNKAVSWTVQDQAKIGSGAHSPSIGINNDGVIVLSYQLAKAQNSNATNLSTWEALCPIAFAVAKGYQYVTSADVYETRICIGALANNAMNWLDDRFVGWGNKYSVSLANDFALIAQLGAASINGDNEIVGNDSNLSIYTSRIIDITDFTDRANWMKNNCRSRKIKNLIMPAAHDAGMYKTQDCFASGDDTAKTQDKNFAQMLSVGIRYFDIRPSYHNNDIYTRHSTLGFGCYGGKVSEILADVKNFVAAHQEVVFLKFSHYNNFSSANMTTLYNMVTEALGDYLLASTNGGRIADMEIGDIVTGSTGVVIPVFDKLNDSDHGPLATGLYTYIDYSPHNNNSTAASLVVYDEYADDDSLKDMRKDQLNKMHTSANHGGDLFLLSWTLTQQIMESDHSLLPLDQLTSAIRDYAQLANNTLTQEMSYQQQNQLITTGTLPNILYVDFCDNFVTDIAIWLNQCYLKGYFNS